MLNISAADQHPWYALHVRSNFECVTKAALQQRDYEPFLPSYRTRRQWSDRVKETEQPLFPGYIFCRIDLAKRLPILQAPGVVGIVKIGNEPAAISEQEIEAIRVTLVSGLKVQPWPFMKTGDRVVVRYGPLKGIEGILKEQKGNYRIVLSVSMMQRSMAAEIDREWVEPSGKASSRSMTQSNGHTTSQSHSSW